MIKVEHTKTITTYEDGIVKTTALVTDAELVLVECKPEEHLIYKGFSEDLFLKGSNDHKLVYNHEGEHFKPILISRTEKIYFDDWFENEFGAKIRKCKTSSEDNVFIYDENNNPYYRKTCNKILALSEHFSPQQLQDIVDGKLKDGDKVFIECIQEEPIPMTYKGVDSRGDYLYYCPKCGWGGSYMGIGQVHCYKDECRETTVKLNPHITIYPVEERRMYTREEMEEKAVAFAVDMFNKNYKLDIAFRAQCNDSVKEWFEQNVK